MSEGVEILISADDQASAKLAQVAKATEQNVKQIKEVGGTAKTSTEFVGQLAGAFGNSEIAGFAGQLAGLTEKVSAFSEVSKAGGAGATIFKAGLIAATAYVSFNVGKYIGDWAFETEKLKKEMEGVATKTKESMEMFTKFQSAAAAGRQADLDLIKDPEDKKKAIQDLTKTLEKELANQEKALKGARKVAEESAEAQRWNYIGNDIIENTAKLNDEAVIASEAKVKALQDEVTELRRATNGEDERREAIARSIATQEQWQELVAQEQQKNIDERIKEAEKENKQYQEQVKLAQEQLAAEKQKDVQSRIAEAKAANEEYVAEVKALEASRKSVVDERIKEAEAANKAYEDEKEKVEELIKGEKERLAIKKIALEQGETAAKQKEFEMKGVDADTAYKLASEDAMLTKQQKDQDAAKKFGEATTNTASESRLLTRGPSQDNGVALLKSSQDIFKELQEARKEAAQARREAQTKAKQVKLELVS
jgi:hypothetical protein